MSSENPYSPIFVVLYWYPIRHYRYFDSSPLCFGVFIKNMYLLHIAPPSVRKMCLCVCLSNKWGWDHGWMDYRSAILVKIAKLLNSKIFFSLMIVRHSSAVWIGWASARCSCLKARVFHQCYVECTLCSSHLPTCLYQLQTTVKHNECH